MPNHVMNRIVLTDYAPSRRDAILAFLAGPEGELGTVDFNVLVPMPDEVYRGPLGPEEIKRYPGQLNWYQWSLAHWGTKWNAYDCARVGDDIVEFCTAWSAVPELMQKLSEEFGEATIYYYWADEMLGYNVGGFAFRGGEVVEEIAPEEGEDEALALAREVWGIDEDDEDGE